MSKNTFRIILSKSILVVLISLAGSNAAFAGGGSIVGSWTVETTYPELDVTTSAVSTINKEKTLTTTTQDGATAIGIWRKSGNNEYQIKLVSIVEPGDPNGFPAGTIVTLLGVGTYDKKTDTVTGSGGTVTWTYGEDNAVLFQTTSQSVFTRITFDE